MHQLLSVILLFGVLQTPVLASPPTVSEEKGDGKKEAVKLWPVKAPIDKNGRQLEISDAVMTVHFPESPTGTAIIICPGGGYGGLVKGPEGHGIAKWLNQHGITGIVLEYRLPKGRPYVPLHDAQRAIRLTRVNAEKWNLKKDRVGIMGFSAGGHLAGSAATHFDSGSKNAIVQVDRESCRPDFAILVYPVVSMISDSTHKGSRRNLLGGSPNESLMTWFSLEKQVTDSTPPMFLAHALDDKPVPPANSRDLHKALEAKNIRAKYVELASGGHGLNGYKGPMWDRWQKESLIWLKKIQNQ